MIQVAPPWSTLISQAAARNLCWPGGRPRPGQTVPSDNRQRPDARGRRAENAPVTTEIGEILSPISAVPVYKQYWLICGHGRDYLRTGNGTGCNEHGTAGAPGAHPYQSAARPHDGHVAARAPFGTPAASYQMMAELASALSFIGLALTVVTSTAYSFPSLCAGASPRSAFAWLWARRARLRRGWCCAILRVWPLSA